MATGENSRLKNKYETDVKKMRFIKVLLSKCVKELQDTEGQREKTESAKQNEDGESTNPKNQMSDLSEKEREILFTKVIQMIDNQLIQADVN